MKKLQETKTIVRVLRCQLTQQELVEAARQSAELTAGIGALEEDKSRVAKDYAARIAEKESSRSLLNGKVVSGYEFRDVKCDVVLSWSPGMKRVVRQDTGEEVAVEAMTPDELQHEIDFSGKGVADEN